MLVEGENENKSEILDMVCTLCRELNEEHTVIKMESERTNQRVKKAFLSAITAQRRHRPMRADSC
jgi:hypothetical protein